MGKIKTKPTNKTHLGQALIKGLNDAISHENEQKQLHTETVKIVEVPVEVIKEVIVEVPVKCECKPETKIIEKIVEVPKVEIEYVTIREIEKVEIPVEKIVEKVIKVHDIEQVIIEKRKTDNALRKVKILSGACASLIILTIIMAVL